MVLKHEKQIQQHKAHHKKQHWQHWQHWQHEKTLELYSYKSTLVRGAELDRWAKIDRGRTNRNLAVHDGNIQPDIATTTREAWLTPLTQSSGSLYSQSTIISPMISATILSMTWWMPINQ
jgi:hypothetical protein